MDEDVVLTKTPDTMLSNLPIGCVVIKFTSEDSLSLATRTHVYELEIVLENDTFKPILADFKVFDSLSA